MSHYEDYDNHCGDCQPMDEFSMGINEMINEEIKRRIKQTVDDLNRYKNKYNKLESDYYICKKEKYELEQNYKKELENAVREKELEIKRTFAKGYAVNDTVYYKKGIQHKEKCDKCEGKGKVSTEVLGKVVEVKCPHCNWNGYNITYTYVPEKDTIRSIKFWYSRVEHYDKKSSGVIKGEFNIWLDKYDNDKREEDLYKTLEECQAACDEVNKPKESK